LGNPTEVSQYGHVVVVGGGLGIAPIYPIAKAMKKAGNKVSSIIGAKSKNYLFWEDKLGECGKVIVCTDDGSKGKQGFVSNALKELMEKEHINRVIVIGPPIMMKVVSELTRNRVKTIASLNPIMVDGMGMCGGCRVVVDSHIKFACCDGPEFDAHQVDWDELMNRSRAYIEEEVVCKAGTCKQN